MMEYGLQLKVLEKPLQKQMQQCQNMVLRAIMSAARFASINGLHKILQLPKMKFRNEFLNATYMGRLQNNEDLAIPVVRLYRARLALPTLSNIGGQRPTATAIIKASLMTLTQRLNYIWPSLGLRNHLAASFGNEQDTPELLTAAMKLRLTISHVQDMEPSRNNVAGNILVGNDLILNLFLKPTCMHTVGKEYRKERVAIQKWLVVGVANHQRCLNRPPLPGSECLVQPWIELSRKNAIECSGVLPLLNMHFQNLLVLQDADSRSQMEPLTYFLHYNTVLARSNEAVRQLYACIALIYKKCLGFNIRPNGYWDAPDAAPEAGIG